MSVDQEDEAGGRLVSLDAYRGFVMLAMASGGLALGQVAESSPDSLLWQFLERQSDHVQWRGCSFWDLIQPSFMFIVGVAMSFSYASRKARGDSGGRLFGHAVVRSLVLVALGVFLASAWGKHTNFTFTNVLAQIGLGYLFVFLLLGRSSIIQVLAVCAILVGYWAFFAIHPLPGRDYPYHLVGVHPMFSRLDGFFAHWAKNTNAAADFDRWFLNLFPHPAGEPFRYNDGGYATLNFVPSIATMLFGVLAGELLRSSRSAGVKVGTLLVTGTLCIVLGTVMDETVCPIVKRIWTPSWVIYSAGWTCAMLAGFYAMIDVAGYRRWAFPLVVVGVNSIAIYLMAQLMKPWVTKQLKIHLGSSPFEGQYGPIVQSAAVLFVFWLICFWMDRQKLYVKI
jgi:heparan-alpha-glucosaminide N-acetyltransferase